MFELQSVRRSFPRNLAENSEAASCQGDNGSFTFIVDVTFALSLPRLLPDLTLYMSNTAGVL